MPKIHNFIKCAVISSDFVVCLHAQRSECWRQSGRAQQHTHHSWMHCNILASVCFVSLCLSLFCFHSLYFFGVLCRISAEMCWRRLQWRRQHHHRHHWRCLIWIANICLKFKTNTQSKNKTCAHDDFFSLILIVIFNGLKSLFAALFLLAFVTRRCRCRRWYSFTSLAQHRPMHTTNVPKFHLRNAIFSHFLSFNLSSLSSADATLYAFISVICCWCLMFGLPLSLSFHKHIQHPYICEYTFLSVFPSRFHLIFEHTIWWYFFCDTNSQLCETA